MTQTTREAVERIASRLEGTPLYEGCGEESDMPEYAAATLRALLAEKEAAEARVKVIIDAFNELVANVEGECPSLLDEDSGASQVLLNLMLDARAALAQKGE